MATAEEKERERQVKKLYSFNRSTNIEIQILEQVEGGVVIIYAEKTTDRSEDINTFTLTVISNA